jgi:hypothetical protein
MNHHHRFLMESFNRTRKARVQKKVLLRLAKSANVDELTIKIALGYTI